jgi:hypothetical protein
MTDLLKNTEKHLVEDCFSLHIKNFGKGLLHPVKYQNSSNEFTTRGIRGRFPLKLKKEGLLYINFEVYPMNSAPKIALAGSNDPMRMDGTVAQEIGLELQELTWGKRWYMLCRCGRRCNTLYLPLETCDFACRQCHNLTYLSTRISKNTDSGLFYYTSRKLKLMKMGEMLERVSYAGHYTKRVDRLINMWKNLDVSISSPVKTQGNNCLEEMGYSMKL